MTSQSEERIGANQILIGGFASACSIDAGYEAL
jgi:hypothetical protein